MKQLKQSRAASFIAVALIYLLASAVGIGVYCSLSYAWWLKLLIADVIATVVTFVFSLLLQNASVYDPYWSVQPMVILAALLIGKGEVTLFRALLLAVVCLWGIRLTANWGYTFGNLTHQDWRYTMLKEKTGVCYPVVNFVGIHMVPTLVVWGCVLPAAYACLHEVALSPWSLPFLCVSLAAILLQGLSDIQMHRFRRHRRAPFMREGLWKYSRHPNYLGEILMWWGIALAVVVSLPAVWYLSLGALANTLLFLAVSIPMADARQARKDGFASYKRETRMLLPLPRIKGKRA